MMKLMTSVEMKGNEECLCSYLYNMMKLMKSVETKVHVHVITIWDVYGLENRLQQDHIMMIYVWCQSLVTLSELYTFPW